MCFLCGWLCSKHVAQILSEPPQLPFGWALILPLRTEEAEAPVDRSRRDQEVPRLGLEPRPPCSAKFPSATHPALLLILVSHLRQPLFLKEEFSTAGIEVTKLERTKKTELSFFPRAFL